MCGTEKRVENDGACKMFFNTGLPLLRDLNMKLIATMRLLV